MTPAEVTRLLPAACSSLPDRERSMAIRILIADDHPVVRRGLRALLANHPQWEIVAEAEDGIDAVEKVVRLRPDVVLLDISMPRMDGLEACRRIRKLAPACEVLIVTQHDTQQMSSEALKAGARGYVVKSNTVRDLLPAVEAVSQHKSFSAPHTGLSGDPA